ncbi:MAG: PD40 domain-containing protein [Anaerolineae bacterium]|nr:PD40 domain-containing protein [Anaerolineae bacterium]
MKSIRYLAIFANLTTPREIGVTDIGAGQTSRIGGEQVWWAAWSPREPELLVVNVQFETSIVNVRTGQWTKIDSFEDRGLFAAWTPDGQWLFAPVVDRAIHPVQEEGILIVDKGDQTSRWIDVEGLGKVAWSPDGKIIAYTSSYPDWKGSQLKNLLVMNSDGEERRLLIGHEVMNVYSEPFVWSPDSRWIAGFGQPTGDRHSNLYLVNVCTGEIEILAEGIMPQDEMVWIPVRKVLK